MGFDKPQAEEHSLPKADLSPCGFSLVELQAHTAVFWAPWWGLVAIFKKL